MCGDKGSCKLAAEVSKYIYSSSRMLQSKSRPILNPLEISVVFWSGSEWNDTACGVETVEQIEILTLLTRIRDFDS